MIYTFIHRKRSHSLFTAAYYSGTRTHHSCCWSPLVEYEGCFQSLTVTGITRHLCCAHAGLCGTNPLGQKSRDRCDVLLFTVILTSPPLTPTSRATIWTPSQRAQNSCSCSGSMPPCLLQKGDLSHGGPGPTLLSASVKASEGVFEVSSSAGTFQI